jgi:hypothetical protein
MQYIRMFIQSLVSVRVSEGVPLDHGSFAGPKERKHTARGRPGPVIPGEKRSRRRKEENGGGKAQNTYGGGLPIEQNSIREVTEFFAGAAVFFSIVGDSGYAAKSGAGPESL